jgi:phosphatidate cytidylyltransferase
MTSVIGLPLLLAVVYAGGWCLQLLLLGLSLIGLSEFYNAMSGNLPLAPNNADNWRSAAKNAFAGFAGSTNYIGFIFAIVYYILIPNIGSNSYFFILITLIITLSLVAMVVFHSKINIIDCAVTLFGFFYVAFLLSFIYLIRMHSYGAFFVWLVFICAFGSDSFAYFAGKAIGKRKMTPNLSPNKTVEGAVAGVAGAGLLAIVYGACMGRFLLADEINIVIYCAIIGISGAAFSIFGDLAASAVKRFTGIKDFGKIFPGHGGILDRFDSVIFAAPMVYMVMILLIER